MINIRDWFLIANLVSGGWILACIRYLIFLHSVVRFVTVNIKHNEFLEIKIIKIIFSIKFICFFLGTNFDQDYGTWTKNDDHLIVYNFF